MLRQVQRTGLANHLHQLSIQKGCLDEAGYTKLDAFVDSDGLIRVGGHIRRSTLSSEWKHPIVLPASSIIGHYHQQVHHQGRGILYADICSHGFWILGLQRLVKSLIHSCVVGSRLRGQPCEQKMYDLPANMLSPDPQLLFRGSDILGLLLSNAEGENSKDMA